MILAVQAAPSKSPEGYTVKTVLLEGSLNCWKEVTLLPFRIAPAATVLYR